MQKIILNRIYLFVGAMTSLSELDDLEIMNRNKEYTFKELVEMTRQVITAFDKVEQRPWSIEVTMLELIKQVGDLAKHILMHERYYLQDRANNPNYRTSVEDIGDELADIMYCVIRIAEHYKIDLEAAHVQARRAEMNYLGQEADF
jgi:NTP pyrophosphatase (non-canonical NTP hydrolase)